MITTTQTTETTKMNNSFKNANDEIIDLSLGAAADKIYSAEDWQQQPSAAIPKKKTSLTPAKFLHIFNLPFKKNRDRSYKTSSSFGLEKALNDFEYVKKKSALVIESDEADDINIQNLNNSSDILRNSSLAIVKNNGTYIIFGTYLFNSSNKNKSAGIKKLTNAIETKSRQKKPSSNFLRRRLLSLNEIETPNR